MSNSILQAHGLTFEFPQLQVFKHFSASFPVGITYVIGGECSGKSTLLRLFAGDLIPQAGSIEVRNFSSKDSLLSYKKNIYWIDPRTSAYDQISSIDFFDLQRKVYPAFDDTLLLELIEGFSLKDHVSKKIYMLSAGSKRKVWLATAFASNAIVTLLDEPFSALDKASIKFLIEQLKLLNQNTNRAWVIADYEVPQNLSAIYTINLDL
jgi:ABC-type multidrug transport system ATPase subunit